MRFPSCDQRGRAAYPFRFVTFLGLEPSAFTVQSWAWSFSPALEKMRGSWNRETRRGRSLVFLPWSQDSPALPQHYLMFHEYESAWMLLQRWTAPTRHVRHPKKGQYHRRGQSYPTVPSTACSELLTARERDRPGENASCCDPDKGPTQRQGPTLDKVIESVRLGGKSYLG